ncbi:hypothetical protein BJ165DRAFT_17356 [Panaeolus papilionaceus]|nr:hypothetical protein BJ165DRAFT_17356 [Panaeolus papilionaceus]
MSTADQDFDHSEVAHGSSTFQVPFSRRESPYARRQNGHPAVERKRKKGSGEEPTRGRASEGQCKFDGTDYPSWLEFDPLKKPDEPYTFPFPAVDGDPWEKVSRMVKRHDNHMCDAWVEEIQNILIFAGLFSAVVTAFAVETQKLLQPDPSMTSVVLLVQIANHLMPNASTIENPALTSQPPSVSVKALRINTFIFISLILALGTALIGILALQWIRSYKNQELRSHQDQLSIRQGRYQALVDWKVPQIITALPIILQAALVLFFIGLVNFLNSQNSQIAIIIGVVVGIILAAVLFTTVAPALYVCFLHQTYSHSKPAPIPPYWSPQSWLFYQLSMSINALWSLVRGKFWIRDSMVSSWDDFLLRTVPNRSEGSFDHWLSPALGWVFQNLTTEESFNSAYHCFQSLSKREIAEEVVVDYLWSDQRSLPRPLQDFKTLESSSYSATLSLYVLQFRFRHRAVSRNIYLHSMELGLRAMACNPARYDNHGNRLPIYFPTSFLLKSEPKVVCGQGSSRGMFITCRFNLQSHHLGVHL